MTSNPFPLVDTWLRFTVLRHYDYPGKHDHYDILLEILEGEDPEQVALDKLESTTDPASPKIAIDHKGLIRRLYLTFEGPMTKNRGFVRRVDEGVYRLTKSGSLEFDGRILRENYSFQEDGDSKCFLLAKV